MKYLQSSQSRPGPYVAIILWILCALTIRAQDPFTLRIVPTESHEGQTPALVINKPFYVVLTNVSKKDMSVYMDYSEWGFYTISLEAKRDDGTIFKLEKRGADFSWNNPETFNIPPGHHYVFQEVLSERGWNNLKALYSGDASRMIFSIKAVYEEPPKEYVSPDKGHPDLWKGRIESKPELFRLRLFTDRGSTPLVSANAGR